MEDHNESTPGFYEEVSSKILEVSGNILELFDFLRIAIDIPLPLEVPHNACIISYSPLLQGLVEPQLGHDLGRCGSHWPPGLRLGHQVVVSHL